MEALLKKKNKYFNITVKQIENKAVGCYNLNFFNLFLLLLIIGLFPLVRTSENKIILKTKGTSSVIIINKNFKNLPNKLLLNGEEIDVSYKITNLPTLNFHVFTLIWDTPLTTFEKMFQNNNHIIDVFFDNFDASSVTSMYYMFYACSSLTSINMQNLITSSVVNMSYMFYACSSLIYLNVKNFDTSQVINMSFMFGNVKALTSIDLTNFRVPLVENMNSMFLNCAKIRFLNLSSFEPLKVTNLDSTFMGLTSLISIDLSNFRTPNVKTMGKTFFGTNILVSLDLTQIDFSKMTNLVNTFNSMNINLKYCLNTTYKQISDIVYNQIKKIQLLSAIEDCSDTCFQSHSEKFIIISKKGTCIDECNQTYKYEYDRECNAKCPAGTRSSPDDEYICIIDLKCSNFYNYDMTECIDDLVDGYYIKNETLKIVDKCAEKCKTCNNESMVYQLCKSCNNNEGYYKMSMDSSEEYFNCFTKEDNYYLDNNTLYPCYDSCLTCDKGGDYINHNCLSCQEGYWSQGTNCYIQCSYYYYFDSKQKYHCTIDNQCPENYKLIEEENRCIDECKNDITYKNEYNNKCYEACPTGYHPDENNKCIIDLVCEHYYNYTHTGCEETIPDGFFCNDIEAKTIDKCPIKCKKCTLESINLQLCTLCNNEENYFKKSNEIFSNEDFVNCYKDLTEGFYLDNNVYMPCFETCKACNGLGNAMNHNCKECNSDFTLNDTNCYKICSNHYYFDEYYNYYCTEDDQCPDEYPKLIVEKNECVESCIDEFKYEFDNKCYKSCPDGTFYNYSYTGCINTIPDGYYNNDTIKKTIEKCDIKCKKCNLESTNNDLCISCNTEENYYLKENDNSNIDIYINCYKNKPDGYYYDDERFKQCYKTCQSCSELGNIIDHKCTACYSNSTLNNTNCYEICSFHYYFDESYNYYCTEDDQCPDEYPKLIVEKNECVESCFDEFKYEFDNKCYKSCPEGTYYNYDHTECIDKVPDGYYLNDSDSQTIDKCDIKCEKCNLESVQNNNLCTSCNENKGYFPKNNDIIENLDYFDCYKENPNGFFFDNDNKIYKECYRTCKSCSEAGDIEDQKCTSCYDGSTLNDTNCYKICDYFYYFENKEYQCTQSEDCPDNFNKLIVDEKECVEKCDNFYKYEYDNKCYKSCPENTFYNYENTGCIDEISDGYYCNDTTKKTIEKCDRKCYNCTLESVQNNNLCNSCNNELGYYQKDNDPLNVDNYVNCYKDITEKYYLDNNIYKPCFDTCKTCNGIGNSLNHNCKECESDSTLNGTNCYKICEFYHYFDELNDYYCTENQQCPGEYPKLIVEKNECVESCIDDFKYEFDNKCYKSCPKGTFYNYEHTGCIDTIADGYFLNDSNSQTIDKCDIKCEKCDLNSHKNNLCISCNKAQQYYLKENDGSNIDDYINCYNQAPEKTFFDEVNQRYSSCYKTCKFCTEVGLAEDHKCTDCFNYYTLNGTNCYKICDYLYYFDKSKEYHCTETIECPSEFPKKIKEKNTCISNCSDDDFYNLEYNNVCYNQCPKGTRIEDDPNLCKGYLICEKLYNYEHTECLEEAPDGFFVNDTEAKTVDKCNDKCKKCSLESNENNLCISCNISGGYYSKEENTDNNNGFIECYTSLLDLSDGYFFDDSDKMFKKCFKTCKKCSNKGNKINHECDECFPGSTLNDSNCYEICEYKYYFDSSKEYHCTENEECPKGYKLIEEKNQCIDNCNNDDVYIYEYKDKCYSYPVKPDCSEDSLYINKITKECLNECNGIDFFNNICGLRDNIDNDNNDLLIKIIETDIESGLMKSLIGNLSNGKEAEFLIKEKEISYKLTSLKDIKNNKNLNTSSLSLGDCEETLRKVYEIDKNQSLIIFQVDYYTNDSLIPVVGYEFFHPLNFTKLDLKYCDEEQLVVVEYPTIINENSLYKYSPNSDYYYDECYPYTTEKGTDILLEDRQKEYNQNKLAICENNCALKEYLSESQKSVCLCEIKTQQISIHEINNEEYLFSNYFGKKLNSVSTFHTMKCYSTLFSIKGIYKNYSFYLISIFSFIFTIISSIIFYKKGYNSLMKIIETIVAEKEKNIENVDIKEKHELNEKKKENGAPLSNILRISTPKHRKISNLTHKGLIPKEDIDSLNNYSNKQKSISRINFKFNKEIKYAKKKTIQLPKNNALNSIDKYNDSEINSFSYEEALQTDKRPFSKYYLSLIKTKHPLIFSFYSLKDYNSIIIKLNLLIFSFCIYYFINGLFINKNIIHKLYENGGKYEIKNYIEKIIYSFLIGHFMHTVIKYFSLSERNIFYIKRENNNKKLYEKVKEVKKLLVSKYICFFSLVLLFELFFGYNLSSFGAVYQNTQLVILENAFISIIISFIYPFVFNLFPVMFRVFSLKNEKKCLYKCSQILQIL